MKKNYMMPSTIVVKIQSQFICTSPGGNGRNVNGISPVSGGAQLSRESSDWDDEE